jgi:hypothetical protein
VGNLIDRARFGAVVDFVDVHWRRLALAAFNVADSAITVGVALLALASSSERSTAAGLRPAGARAGGRATTRRRALDRWLPPRAGCRARRLRR